MAAETPKGNRHSNAKVTAFSLETCGFGQENDIHAKKT